MLVKLKQEMKKQRYTCPSLANDSNLTRYDVYKIIKNIREPRISEVIAISKALNLEIKSIDDLKGFFMP